MDRGHVGVKLKSILGISYLLRRNQCLSKRGRRWNNIIAPFRARSNISTCIAQNPTFCMGHGVEREAKPREQRVRSDDHYMEF